MKIRKMLILAAVFMSLAAVSRAEEFPPSSDKISQKLDAIEQKQNQILKQLDEMKSELYIIKVRASLKS